MVVVVMPDVVMVAFVIMSNLIYFMLGAGPIFSYEQISRCKICRDFFSADTAGPICRDFFTV